MHIQLVRPEDLLNLRVEGINLRLDADDPAAPALVIDDATAAAYLVVSLPPQSIAEQAYFEAAIVQPPQADPANPGQPLTIKGEAIPARPDGTAGKATNEPLDPPGKVRARMGGRSRLVFGVPAGTRIPYTTEGMLDWSNLELSVHPIAAIPPNPSNEIVAQAPGLRAPAPTETALELPYKLIVSPGPNVAWAHRTSPHTAHGRTEMWHTRLQIDTDAGPAELSNEHRAPMRAIWAADAGYNAANRPDPLAPDPDLQRAAMSTDDRYQLVILTSAFSGYEVDADVELAFKMKPLQPFQQGAGFGALQPGGMVGGADFVQNDRLLQAGALLQGGIRGNGPYLDPRERFIPKYTQTLTYLPQPFYAELASTVASSGVLTARISTGRESCDRLDRKIPS